MKKSLLALSLLAAFGAASAESTITLSGVVDASVGQIKKTDTTTTKIGNVTTTNTMVSKSTSTARDGRNNGLSSSRFAISGSEELGNGLKANFRIEQMLDIAQGGGTTGRNTWVGLSGGFGALTVGRQDTPFADAIWGVTDMDSVGSYSLPTTSVARANRSIKYASPRFLGQTGKDGLQVRALIGSDTVKSDMSSITGNVATTSNTDVKNTTTGLSLAYAGGRLAAGFALNNMKSSNDVTVANRTTTTENTTLNTGAGLSYDFTVAKVFFSVWSQKDTANASWGSKKTTDTMLNVVVPFGGSAYVTAGVGRNKMHNDLVAKSTGLAPVVHETTGNNYVLGAGYKFSPRTELYVRYAKQNTVSDVVTSSNTKMTGNTQSFGLGVRHKF